MFPGRIHPIQQRQQPALQPQLEQRAPRVLLGKPQLVRQLIPNQGPRYQIHEIGELPPLVLLGVPHDARRRVNQRIRHYDGFLLRRRLEAEPHPAQFQPFGVVAEQQRFGRAHQPGGVAPDRHKAVLLYRTQPRAYLPYHSQQQRRKRRRRKSDVRRVQRYAVTGRIPFAGFLNQTPHLGVHQPDPHRQLPAVAVPFQPPGQADFQQMPIVLLQPPYAVIAEPAGSEKGLGNQR